MVFLVCSVLYGTVLKAVEICGAAEFLAIRTATSVPRPAEGKKGQWQKKSSSHFTNFTRVLHTK